MLPTFQPVWDVSNVNPELMPCFVRIVLNPRMSDPAVKRVVSNIIRSPEDKREYRGLDFTNGLKAILISDPTTDKSSAALDVHIGKGETRLLVSPLRLGCKICWALIKNTSSASFIRSCYNWL